MLGYSCFTVLCQFLLQSEVDQLYVYSCPSHTSRSSHSSELNSSRCTAGSPYLFYTWQHTYVDASSQFSPPASPPGVSTHPFPTPVPLFLPCK